MPAAVNISDLLRLKPSADNGRPDLVTIAPSDTVTSLLATLAEHNVGALLAVDGADVVGIVSERDVVRRIAQHGAAVLDQPVSAIMTTSVLSCSSGDEVHSVAETMTQRRIRHMPVIDGDTLAGIISIGDVVAARIAQLEHDRNHLEQYISG